MTAKTGPGPQFNPHGGFDWDDLPEEEQERLLKEIKQDMPIEALTRTVVSKRVEDIFSDGNPMDHLTEEQLQTIARDIPAEDLESAVTEDNGMEASELSESPEFTKAVREATLIPLYRVVTIVGAAFTGFATIAAIFAEGYPLAMVLLLTTVFFVYAYRYDFEIE